MERWYPQGEGGADLGTLMIHSAPQTSKRILFPCQNCLHVICDHKTNWNWLISSALITYVCQIGCLSNNYILSASPKNRDFVRQNIFQRGHSRREVRWRNIWVSGESCGTVFFLQLSSGYSKAACAPRLIPFSPGSPLCQTAGGKLTCE